MNQPEATPDPSAAQPSAGQMLRAAREAKGMHLALLSVNLKVSVRQLEALEADRYDELKGLAFVRALAQSVSRQLGIDPAPVLAALPQAAHQRAIAPTALEAKPQALQQASSSTSGKGLSRQVLILAALMLLGVAALVWWPSAGPNAAADADEGPDATQAAVPLGQASDPVESPAPAASGEQAVVVVPPEAPASKAQGTTPAPSPAPAAAPVAAAPAASAAEAAKVASAAPAPAPAALQISLQSDAWVEVRDGHGQMAVRRIVKAGETLQLSPPAPLFVYLGKANSAELRWQGQVLDLKPHTQNNEARLHNKP